jgi:catechol 2,3-dioxygenase
MLPQGTHVGLVTLQVRDLQRSLDYYTSVLGLAVLDRSSDTASLGVRGRPLVRLEARAGIVPVPRGGRFGLFHFAILLPDRPSLGQFLAHLLRSGIRAGMSDHLVSEALYLTDPDGLGIEVYADRPRSTWSWRDGELAMTTEPLAVADLLAAGAGRDWQGAPEGTTMGHVHLHVGDLAAADRFYGSAVGFDKTVWNYPGALFFSAAGYHHHVGTNVWSPGPSAGADQARLLEWQLVLPDQQAVDETARRIESAGHQIERRGRTAVAADPWGTKVALTAEA